jgi:hypothetical protein
MPDTDRFLDRARKALRESKYVEFKEQFETTAEGEWIELIKDFVAIANSGGGVVVIGVANDGSISGADLTRVLALDGAAIADKLMRFVGSNFDEFEVHSVNRVGGGRVAAIVIGSVTDAPLVFIQPGNYVEPRRQRAKTAFARGATYMRHGAKSEPATQEDLRLFIDRRLDQIRDEWLQGLQRVVSAPEGAEIVAIQRSEEEGEPRIRITTDEDAPLYRPIDWDTSHPYRQTELVQEMKERLPGGATFNSHDLLSVRRVYEIDATTRPEFVHLPRFGWYQYSDAFVDWMIAQFERDNEFFNKARRRYHDLRMG